MDNKLKMYVNILLSLINTDLVIAKSLIEEKEKRSDGDLMENLAFQVGVYEEINSMIKAHIGWFEKNTKGEHENDVMGNQ